MTRTLATLAAVLLPAVAAGHPLPNLRFDRTVAVRVAPAGVTVRYDLELNDWTMALDGRDLVTPAELKSIVGSRGFARVYAAKKAPLIADDLRATLDGEPVTVRLTAVEIVPELDHLRLRLTFRADWAPAPGKPHRFAIEDQNFEDRAGTVALTLDPPDGLTVAVSDFPPADLRATPPLDLKPADVKRLRRGTVVFAVPETAAPKPPEVGPPPTDVPVTVAGDPPGVLADLADRGLAALFDSGYGLGLMLLLAFAFGAGHAFTPGHGKTLVAAYLVGERGTVRHAVVLGVTTTLTHTGSVILVAVVLRAVYGEAVPAVAAAVLKLVGGLLIAGVGLWLFLQRAAGRADHVHLFGGHHGEETPSKTSIFRVILLGIAGGMVPCWDAVLLLLLAVTAGRLAVAVPLLIAFSAGLAAVLVALGVAVVYAHRVGGKSFGDRRWFRLLPVASAVLLVGLGVWFSRDGVRDLIAADKAASIREGDNR